MANWKNEAEAREVIRNLVADFYNDLDSLSFDKLSSSSLFSRIISLVYDSI